MPDSRRLASFANGRLESGPLPAGAAPASSPDDEPWKALFAALGSQSALGPVTTAVALDAAAELKHLPAA